MLKQLLKQSDRLELEIFKLFLIEKEPIPVRRLLDSFQISRSSLKRHLAKLNQTFIDLSLDINLLQDTHHDYSLANPQEKEEHFLFYALQLYYLEQSNAFNLLQLLFTKPKIHHLELLQQLHVSEMTLYKLIKSLNVSLNYFSIRINKADNFFYVSGQESHIRFVSSAFFMIAYQNLKWPFQQPSRKQLEFGLTATDSRRIATKPASTQRRIELLFAIFQLRLGGFKLMENFPPLLDEVIQLFPDKYTETLFQLAQTAGSEFTSAEHAFIQMALRAFDINTDSEAEKTVFIHKCLEHSNPLILFSANLYTHFFEAFDLPKSAENKVQFMYLHILYHIFTVMFEFDITDTMKWNDSEFTWSSAENPSELEKAILAFYLAFLKAHDPQKTFKNPAPGACLLLSLYRAVQHKNLKIFVQYSRDLVGEFLIKQKFQAIFQEKTLRFVTDIHQADFVISDCLESENLHCAYFFLEDIYDHNLWQKLLRVIQEKIYEKNFL